MLGEETLQPVGIPYLGFSGNDGAFSIAQKPIKTPVDVIFLGVKKKLGAWTPSARYFTNEYSSYDEVVTLKCATGSATSIIEEGIPVKELKTKDIPGLEKKLSESFILYVMYKGEIYRLDVHGKSSSELIGFYNSLGELKEAEKISDLNELTVSLGSEEFTASNGQKHFKITFTSKGPHSDSKLVASKTAELEDVFGSGD